MQKHLINKPRRWKNYDYSSNGCYFVTICTKNQFCYFGKVFNQEMTLNNFGKIADNYWQQIPKFYHHVALGIFKVMPNHIHGIIIIDKPDTIVVDAGQCPAHSQTGAVDAGQCPASTRNKYGSLSKIINAYKNVCTKTIHRQFPASTFSWQRSFHDHIIRSEKEYEKISYYILNNAVKWENDQNDRALDFSASAKNLKPKPKKNVNYIGNF